MSAAFRVVPLDAGLDRNGFASGSEPLDRYFRERVTQDVRRRIAACFVALAGDQVAGYYTLASASIPLADLPAQSRKKLPKYPSVPAVRMGRLAVHQAFKRQGLGGVLLADALLRARQAEIAAYALIVDAKDDVAVAFYEYHGFIRFESQPTALFLALAGLAP